MSSIPFLLTYMRQTTREIASVERFNELRRVCSEEESLEIIAEEIIDHVKSVLLSIEGIEH